MGVGMEVEMYKEILTSVHLLTWSFPMPPPCNHSEGCYLRPHPLPLGSRARVIPSRLSRKDALLG